MDLQALVWFATVLVALLAVERWTHRHLQGVALLITGDTEVSVFLYALPLLPGVALHEISHALAATILGARVGRISIFPVRQGDRIQLGFVPVEQTGPLKTALIGLAPLLIGCLVLLLIGHLGLGLGPVGTALAAGDWKAAGQGLAQVLRTRDAWLWAYLAFAVSNTMLPSRSDMRAWPVLLLFFALVAGIVLLLEMGPALAQPLSAALRWLAVICTLTLLVDLPFVLLIALLEYLLSRLRGVRVEYR
ncbi:MAG: M50 family metallopeptidase [Anaerolineae bacterium]|nr:M50 family metallopeptidase [Anaerolineae bacterium]MCX8066586.1 M50 family metallopeptidase [Anaerolineae bacterium]MDW7991619.1 M50 family metallopeptidase [Anaerolineae bacterium]